MGKTMDHSPCFVYTLQMLRLNLSVSPSNSQIIQFILVVYNSYIHHNNKIIQVTSHQLQQLVLSLLKRDRLTSGEERQGAQQIVVDLYEIP